MKFDFISKMNDKTFNGYKIQSELNIKWSLELVLTTYMVSEFKITVPDQEIDVSYYDENEQFQMKTIHVDSSNVEIHVMNTNLWDKLHPSQLDITNNLVELYFN